MLGGGQRGGTRTHVCNAALRDHGDHPQRPFSGQLRNQTWLRMEEGLPVSRAKNMMFRGLLSNGGPRSKAI